MFTNLIQELNIYGSREHAAAFCDVARRRSTLRIWRLPGAVTKCVPDSHRRLQLFQQIGAVTDFGVWMLLQLRAVLFDQPHERV